VRSRIGMPLFLTYPHLPTTLPAAARKRIAWDAVAATHTRDSYALPAAATW